MIRADGARIRSSNDLIYTDRLMQASPEFRQWWSRHDIGAVAVSHKELNHPLGGLLVLQPTTLVLADDPNLKLFLYTPLAQADTAEKLAWLANTSHDIFSLTSPLLSKS